MSCRLKRFRAFVSKSTSNQLFYEMYFWTHQYHFWACILRVTALKIGYGILRMRCKIRFDLIFKSIERLHFVGNLGSCRSYSKIQCELICERRVSQSPRRDDDEIAEIMSNRLFLFLLFQLICSISRGSLSAITNWRVRLQRYLQDWMNHFMDSDDRFADQLNIVWSTSESIFDSLLC